MKDWLTEPDSWRTWRWVRFWARLVLRVKQPLVIGITGSVGKTTTRAHVLAVLTHPEARRVIGRAGGTPLNLNDAPNLPLAILGFDRYLMRWNTPLLWYGLALRALLRALRCLLPGGFPRVLVLELGTSRPGRIASMTTFVRPGIGVVTTIGPAHLEHLGDLDGVVREKGALLRGLVPPALAILGEDHDYVDALAAQAPGEVLRVPGRGAELAAGIARMIGARLGVPETAIEEALAGVSPVARRLQRIEAGRLTLIDDSFNANPQSMALALDTLAASPVGEGGRRVAVLGTMGELGPSSADMHRATGAQARRQADLVIGVGAEARDYGPDHWFPDSRACADALPGLVQPGDCVLIKGSGSARMACIVQRLRA
ncbi:MAG: hypothetical protein JJT85_07540 [Chromatiales bacterium]|nr:hypothetical protein [Chromatiales bacterium]